MRPCRSFTFRQHRRLLRDAVIFLLALPSIACTSDQHGHANFHSNAALHSRQQATEVPLVVSNKCGETIHPGILSQSGQGPGITGFALSPGSSRTMTVSEDWQGRVWGRTNCSFNSQGTAPANGIPGVACTTGDCGGTIACAGAGVVPVTLAEFTLDPGYGQSFYDISLVDGYNLPVAIRLIPHGNSSLGAIPPRLTNPSCVGTVGNVEAPNYNPYSTGNGQFLGTNASDPLSFENKQDKNSIAKWCPWNLQVTQSKAPSGGIYTYPDGSLDRPPFDPCFSACAKTGLPQDCCTGSYNSPNSCTGGVYSTSAKGVCPDAYSYAFDDQTSTFIVPSGAGFEVIFCPGARSTNILATSKAELTQLAQNGLVTKRSVLGGLERHLRFIDRTMDLQRREANSASPSARFTQWCMWLASMFAASFRLSRV